MSTFDRDWLDEALESQHWFDEDVSLETTVTTHAWITQAILEAAVQPESDALVTQAALEVAIQTDSDALVTQSVLEVLILPNVEPPPIPTDDDSPATGKSFVTVYDWTRLPALRREEEEELLALLAGSLE